jgi:hypothetical protein
MYAAIRQAKTKAEELARRMEGAIDQQSVYAADGNRDRDQHLQQIRRG